VITPSDIAKVVWIVRNSRAAETLEDLRGKKKAGAPSGFNTELFLIGALLCSFDGDGFLNTGIHTVLTEMDRHWQVKLGIRDNLSAPPNFGLDSVDRMSTSIRDAIEYGIDSMQALSDEERARRRPGLMRMIDALLDQTLVVTESSYRSVDATGVWSWGRSPRVGGAEAIEKEAAKLEAAGRHEDAAIQRAFAEEIRQDKAAKKNAAKPGAVAVDAAKAQDLVVDDSDEALEDPDAVLDGDPQKKRGHDPDARSSGKTKKGGGTEWFFGYHLHALVRVAEPGWPYTSEPVLIERLEVTPAGQDMIWASQEVIRRAQPTEYELTVVADRWYSNLTEDNWFHFLRANGWWQVVDMRENDQSWTDVRGTRVTAGWPHCPATPDEMERIPKPFAPGPVFFGAIEKRFAYALDLHAEDPDGLTRRFTCPALRGKVRCANRPKSLAADASLPRVENPPALDTAPDCCKQTTITVQSDDRNAKGRLWQPRYFGTPEQVEQLNRRTSVEQAFARLKSKDGTNMGRGFVRVTGMARVTLAVGLMAVATNIRELET